MILTSGERHEAAVEHARGTIGNPMSDEAIEAKFTANAEPVIGAARAQQVRDLVWGLETLPDVCELTVLCA